MWRVWHVTCDIPLTGHWHTHSIDIMDRVYLYLCVLLSMISQNPDQYE